MLLFLIIILILLIFILLIKSSFLIFLPLNVRVHLHDEVLNLLLHGFQIIIIVIFIDNLFVYISSLYRYNLFLLNILCNYTDYFLLLIDHVLYLLCYIFFLLIW